jgi:hypothetical protein
MITRNEAADGYRGIWYSIGPSNDEYAFKYSGGLGTYCAKHQPFAVYAPQVERTFFCYGGAAPNDNRRLWHMVSFYDHATGQVPRPTLLLDKETDDAHDNPVISLDGDGHVWIFSTSHGTSRPSCIHRSVAPFDVTEFELVPAVYRDGDAATPIDNFSYFQAWHHPRQGFLCFQTRYSDPARRTLFFSASRDGLNWRPPLRLAGIEQGHYQISATGDDRLASAFNYHPADGGLDHRTNLYYVQSDDFGRSWQSASGEDLILPLSEVSNPALVHDFAEDGMLVYLKDIRLDEQGRPIVLVLTSPGSESGPGNAPRTWTICRWTGRQWDIRPGFTSDSNYDMGSLYLESDEWRIIAPTEPGPQPYNPGGEVAMWVSRDEGASWQRQATLTRDSEFNHTYVRRPVDAHPDFYAFWADGHGRQPSQSHLYFCTRQGHVFMLPPEVEADWAAPIPLKRAE